MGQPMHVVKLLKNHIYPTYQLYAQMANSKTTPQEGLRIGALTVMHWLRLRLGDNIPPELECVPEIEEYKNLDDDCLPSVYLNQGFVVNIVSMPARGSWCLQISEPDLGSDPGNAEQSRSAVPGRVIETNIAFHIHGADLECGFQTVISDPDGVNMPAEVYRPAVIRQLVRNPNFGLRQIFPIEESSNTTTCSEDCKMILSQLKDPHNQLPFVLFAEWVPARKSLSSAETLQKNVLTFGHRGSSPFDPPPELLSALDSAPKYDISKFAKSCVSFARVFLISNAQREKFKSLANVSYDPGDIIVMEPPCFGGKTRVIRLKSSPAAQEKTLERLKVEMQCYPRGKAYSFGYVSFLSAARSELLKETDAALKHSNDVSEENRQEIERLTLLWKKELDERDSVIEALEQRVLRQKEEVSKIEAEKASLRDTHAAELAQVLEIISEKDASIAYLKRKLDQPKVYADIPAWIEKYFSGRILLHKRAVDELCDKSAKSTSVSLICDALDYLATDYWERRYAGLPDDIAKTRCSEKYGRPFDTGGVGAITIDAFPKEYKIKYFPNFKGKPSESPLDYHLRVGNDVENLLRIYYLHDDEKQLIVIGSLPKHLSAITVG